MSSEMAHDEATGMPALQPMASPSQDDRILTMLTNIQNDLSIQRQDIQRLKAADRQSFETTDEVYDTTMQNLSSDNQEFYPHIYAANLNSNRYRNSRVFGANRDRQTYAESRTLNPHAANWFSNQMGNIVPSANSFTSITKSITPADPKTSLCILKALNFISVHGFTKDFLREQQKHPDEQLLMGSYISFKVTLQIAAFDTELKLSNGKLIIVGEVIKLDNAELFHIIFKIVAPKSTEEFITNISTIVKFAKPPSNYILDPLKWQWMYEQYLLYCYTFSDVYNMLTCNPEYSFAPPLKSKNGRLGLIELINDAAPLNAGNYIHAMLDPIAVKEVRHVNDYLSLIKKASALLQQNSHDNALTNSRFFTTNKTKYDTTLVTPFNPQTPHSLNRNNTSPSHHTPHRNNNNSTPYSNPHLNALNRNASLHRLRNYNVDFDDDSSYPPAYIPPYNPHVDEPVAEYDLYDPYVDSLPLKSCPSSPYDEPDLYAFPSAPAKLSKDMPCFDMFKNGKCTLTNCMYNHDKKVMTDEWYRRSSLLNKSPYASPPKTILTTPHSNFTNNRDYHPSPSIKPPFTATRFPSTPSHNRSINDATPPHVPSNFRNLDTITTPQYPIPPTPPRVQFGDFETADFDYNEYPHSSDVNPFNNPQKDQ